MVCSYEILGKDIRRIRLRNSAYIFASPATRIVVYGEGVRCRDLVSSLGPSRATQDLVSYLINAADEVLLTYC